MDQLDSNQAPDASPPPRSGSSGWFWAGAVVLVVAALVLVAAWNHGKDLATREEAITGACRAAASSDTEYDACVQRMEEGYRGPLTGEATANAAAQHVADMQADVR